MEEIRCILIGMARRFKRKNTTTKNKETKRVKSQREKNKKTGELNMTETTLLVLVLLFLAGSLGVVVYYDRKIVKAIAEYEKRLDKKGILKRHFSKPIT